MLTGVPNKHIVMEVVIVNTTLIPYKLARGISQGKSLNTSTTGLCFALDQSSDTVQRVHQYQRIIVYEQLQTSRNSLFRSYLTSSVQHSTHITEPIQHGYYTTIPISVAQNKH